VKSGDAVFQVDRKLLFHDCCAAERRLRQLLRLPLRQNLPACAPWAWPLSFPCHCPAVVGFSRPGL